jgi:hypothetical protein
MLRPLSIPFRSRPRVTAPDAGLNEAAAILYLVITILQGIHHGLMHAPDARFSLLTLLHLKLQDFYPLRQYCPFCIKFDLVFMHLNWKLKFNDATYLFFKFLDERFPAFTMMLAALSFMCISKTLMRHVKKVRDNRRRGTVSLEPAEVSRSEGVRLGKKWWHTVDAIWVL